MCTLNRLADFLCHFYYFQENNIEIDNIYIEFTSFSEFLVVPTYFWLKVEKEWQKHFQNKSRFTPNEVRN